MFLHILEFYGVMFYDFICIVADNLMRGFFLCAESLILWLEFGSVNSMWGYASV